MNFVAWCAWLAFGFGVIAIMFMAALDTVMEKGKFEIEVWRKLVKERLYRLIQTSLIMPAVGIGAALGYSMYHEQPNIGRLNAVIQEGGLAPLVGALILGIVIIVVCNSAFIGAFDETPREKKFRRYVGRFLKDFTPRGDFVMVTGFPIDDDQKSEIRARFAHLSVKFEVKQELQKDWAILIRDSGELLEAIRA